MPNGHPYDDVRAAFTDADTRFQQSLSSAFAAHSQCVAAFFALLSRVERREAELQESVDELKRLVIEQGAQLRQQGEQITALQQQVAAQGTQIADLQQRQRIDARGQQQ